MSPILELECTCRAAPNVGSTETIVPGERNVSSTEHQHRRGGIG